MDNREIYKSKEFAIAWHEHQSKQEDMIRTRVANKIIIKELGSLRNKIVLEAGCGNGFFIKYLKELNPKEIYAFDISPHLVEISKQQFPDVKYDAFDLMEKLDYKTEFFDTIVCYNVLMEMPKIENAVKELARITKKNGEIHIILIHTLYNLFINDKDAEKETLHERLIRYIKEESLTVNTIKGYNDFIVHRRPLSMYINEFSKNGLFIKKMQEITIPKELAKLNAKYERKIGVPVFAYFVLRKM